MAKEEFLPVLLGTGLNSYIAAREFHREYGIKSLVVGREEMDATRFSKIVDVLVFPGFDEQKTFVSRLAEVAEKYGKGRKLILVSGGDYYSELVIKNKKELSKNFTVPFISEKLMDKMLSKADFYHLCEEYGLSYPNTVVVDKANYRKITPEFGFPRVIKASDSVRYTKVEFKGKKKAYIIETEEEYQEVLERVYQSAYEGELIVQDFIPGGDETKRVVNTYSDSSGKVRDISMGKILLEDKHPKLIGNYNAITSGEEDEGVFREIRRFLDGVGYVGVANFDFKRDPRDGKYKVFEINLRHGGSSFYAMAGGWNMAKYYVEDWIYGKKIKVGKKSKILWLDVPRWILGKYGGEDGKKVLRKYRRAEYSLKYKADFGFRRKILFYESMIKHVRNYFRYGGREDEVRGD